MSDCDFFDFVGFGVFEFGFQRGDFCVEQISFLGFESFLVGGGSESVLGGVVDFQVFGYVFGEFVYGDFVVCGFSVVFEEVGEFGYGLGIM